MSNTSSSSLYLRNSSNQRADDACLHVLLHSQTISKHRYRSAIIAFLLQSEFFSRLASRNTNLAFYAEKIIGSLTYEMFIESSEICDYGKTFFIVAGSASIPATSTMTLKSINDPLSNNNFNAMHTSGSLESFATFSIPKPSSTQATVTMTVVSPQLHTLSIPTETLSSMITNPILSRVVCIVDCLLKTLPSLAKHDIEKEFVPNFIEHSFQPGQAIFTSGSPISSFFILRSGSCVLTSATDARRIINPTELFGHEDIALAERIATCTVTRDAVVYEIDKRVFMEHQKARNLLLTCALTQKIKSNANERIQQSMQSQQQIQPAETLKTKSKSTCQINQHRKLLTYQLHQPSRQLQSSTTSHSINNLSNQLKLDESVNSNMAKKPSMQSLQTSFASILSSPNKQKMVIKPLALATGLMKSSTALHTQTNESPVKLSNMAASASSETDRLPYLSSSVYSSPQAVKTSSSGSTPTIDLQANVDFIRRLRLSADAGQMRSIPVTKFFEEKQVSSLPELPEVSDVPSTQNNSNSNSNYTSSRVYRKFQEIHNEVNEDDDSFGSNDSVSLYWTGAPSTSLRTPREEAVMRVTSDFHSRGAQSTKSGWSQQTRRQKETMSPMKTAKKQVRFHGCEEIQIENFDKYEDLAEILPNTLAQSQLYAQAAATKTPQKITMPSILSKPKLTLTPPLNPRKFQVIIKKNITPVNTKTNRV